MGQMEDSDRPAEDASPLRATPLRNPRTGEVLPPTLSPAEAAVVLGWPERTVRDHARKGLLETMKRPGARGQHRIITAKLLASLGLLDDKNSVN
jgi:hypothetical protein